MRRPIRVIVETAVAIAIDACAECEARLREAGLANAAAHAHDATETLRLTQRTAAERRSLDGDPHGGHRGALVTEDGRSTGFLLRRGTDGRGELVALRARIDGGFPEGTRPLAFPSRDLGAELVSHPEAAAFAQDGLRAALLRMALSQNGWIASRDRARWSTSSTGADTILRLMRAGAPAAALRPTAHGLVEASVADLLASLGWTPGLVRRG